MNNQANYEAQIIDFDYGDEVPSAFGYTEGNKRLNDEMLKRAIERAKLKKQKGPTAD